LLDEGEGTDVTVQHLVMLAVRTSIILTVFGFGLDATATDVLDAIRRPGLLARSLLAMFIIMPIVAIILAEAFSLLPEVEIALVALALSPVPPLLPRREGKAGGAKAYALGLMAVAAALSIVVIPVALWILGRFFDKSFAISSLTIAKIVVAAALLPLTLGMALRAAAPALAERIAKPVGLVAAVLLSLGLVAILFSTLPAMVGLIGNGTLFAMIFFAAVGLAVGHLMGGPTADDRIVLALSTATRHPAIAIAIGAATYPADRLLPAVLLYLVVSALVGIPYIKWQRRQRIATVSAGVRQENDGRRVRKGVAD
jgi:bile acid:Na+ symporter, BASS family